MESAAFFSLHHRAKEGYVGQENNFEKQLARINADLNDSLARLHALMEKTLSEINSPELRYNPAQREHLEQVVRGLEEKIAEIRAIGLPRP